MHTKKLLLRIGNTTQTLAATDICYISAEGSYSHIYLVDGRKVTLSKNLNAIEQRLEEYDFFCRIHHSHFVNVEQIAQLQGQKIELLNGITLPISRNRREALINLFCQL